MAGPPEQAAARRPALSDAQAAALVDAAVQVRQRAYAPYSGFWVGAAVLTADGRIFSGANVENASYGLTLCAERTAVARAVVEGAREIVAVAVASGTSPPASPCGMCRQTLAEFAQECEIILVGPGEQRRLTLEQLLPLAFRPAALSLSSSGKKEPSASEPGGSDEPGA